MSQPINLTIVGSIGIDTIETPTEKRERSLVAPLATPARQLPSLHKRVWSEWLDRFSTTFRDQWRMKINLDGLQTQEGKTFRWSGIYEANMDNRTTLSTELNVFEEFSPNLPETYREAPYLFLGNIHPALQLHVLKQVNTPRFVLIDTMDLWIDIAKEELTQVIGKCDMLTLNESEAQLFTGEHTSCRRQKP